MKIQRLPNHLTADDGRVISRLFHPSDQIHLEAVIQRILALKEDEAQQLLQSVLKDFRPRHRDLETVYEDHYKTVQELMPPKGISRTRQLLIGAHLTMEYAVESVALFNPSIVPALNQNGLPKGSTRFIMSLRATGEGHVSSIVFRRGVIDVDNHIEFDNVSRYTHRLRMVEDRLFDRHTYRLKLIEMGAYNPHAEDVISSLSDQFTLDDLKKKVEEFTSEKFNETSDNMLWLARSNYHLVIPPDVDPSQIVIFPSTENESRGIEDVRLVRFIDNGGQAAYYGTYTAYNGYRILPQLIETTDFRTVKIHTLNGRFVQNKGLALFPRKVGGWYMMISRLDGENLYLMKSDNIRFWNEAQTLQQPRFPWEFIQIGNCGSPLETDRGWLLLTHGVGAMRQYCIGATLLDLEDPSRIIGQTSQPLLMPRDNERNGYVPNVVYTCGAMIHRDTLVIPHAINDKSTRFATVPLHDLLQHLTNAS